MRDYFSSASFWVFRRRRRRRGELQPVASTTGAAYILQLRKRCFARCRVETFDPEFTGARHFGIACGTSIQYSIL